MIKVFFQYLILFNTLVAQNNYPIVLIHGFMGWGPDEMGNYNYWGGKNNYVDMLKSEGFDILEVSVGPISSNWERAIEVYYQLKGGQVDYGKYHSEKYGIIQKPKNKYYQDPLYKEWDENNPIHLIGHSMGSQTSRMLLYLLSNSFYGDNNDLESSSLLSEIHSKMIRSITSISGPNNGTTLTGIVTKTIPFIQYFVGIAGLVGGNRFFDFDLEQWGFYRFDNERWPSYLNRLRNHQAFKTKNISSWDLSLEGAKELNGVLMADPDVYYFSLVTSTTKRKTNSINHVPSKGTSIITKSRAKLIGSRSGFWGDGSSTDSTWYENDGVVNSVSMYGPKTGVNGSDPIIKFDSDDILIPGQWYWQKVNDMDHWNIIGHLCDDRRREVSKNFFLGHVQVLKNLPNF